MANDERKIDVIQNERQCEDLNWHLSKQNQQNPVECIDKYCENHEEFHPVAAKDGREESDFSVDL